MKKFIRILTFFLVLLPVFLLVACGEKREGGDDKSKVSWKYYGIGSMFQNSSDTCELTLREVVATESISYGGADYLGKSKYMLIVKADVKFTDYSLDKWGVEFRSHWLNFKKINDAYHVCSIREDSGFELALSKIVNPNIDFNAENQNYSGEIYMIFCLDEENYSYLNSQKIYSSPNDQPCVLLRIDEMIINGITLVEIGCAFNEVDFQTNYIIN